MKPAIQIHCGPGKTGSSALQKHLLEASAQLEQQSVFYPRHELDAAGVSSGNYWSIMQRQPNGKEELSWPKLEQLQQEKRERNCKQLLLSSEAFFVRMPEMARLLPQARFIVYLRNPLHYMESLYNQKVKRHGYTEPFHLENDRPSLAIIRHLADFIQDFGRERLSLRFYQGECFKGGNIISDFYHAIGLIAPEIKASLRVNPSYSFEALELKRQLNQLPLSAYAHYRLDRSLQGHDGEHDFSLLPPDEFRRQQEWVITQLKAFFKLHPFSGHRSYLQALKLEKPRTFRPQNLQQQEYEEILRFVGECDIELAAALKARTRHSAIRFPMELRKALKQWAIDHWRWHYLLFRSKENLHSLRQTSS